VICVAVMLSAGSELAKLILHDAVNDYRRVRYRLQSYILGRIEKLGPKKLQNAVEAKNVVCFPFIDGSPLFEQLREHSWGKEHRVAIKTRARDSHYSPSSPRISTGNP